MLIINKSKKLWQLFSTFFRIGLFTFGGGLAMIPLIEREVVEKNGWLEKDKFLDAISLTQSAPGAIAINLSVFIGYNYAGVPGAAAAVLGVSLPSFLIILLIAISFQTFSENPLVERIFMGIRPAVVALIIYTGLNFLRALDWSWKIGGFFFLVLLGNILLDINPFILIVLAVIIGTLNYLIERNLPSAGEKKEQRGNSEQ